jgi:hypothetical protein
MWIFTPYGAYFPSQRPLDTVELGDNQLIQIRARRKLELERLKAFYPEIPTGDIIFFPHTDYEYRMYCTHTALGMLMALMAADIDYTKFKPETEKFGESKLHAAYNTIWGILYDRFSTNRYLEQKVQGRAKVKSFKRGNPRKNPQYNWKDGTWD